MTLAFIIKMRIISNENYWMRSQINKHLNGRQQQSSKSIFHSHSFYIFIYILYWIKLHSIYYSRQHTAANAKMLFKWSYKAGFLVYFSSSSHLHLAIYLSLLLLSRFTYRGGLCVYYSIIYQFILSHINNKIRGSQFNIISYNWLLETYRIIFSFTTASAAAVDNIFFTCICKTLL